MLKGINLGGWLLMEGYILGGRNIPEHEFKAKFIKKYNREELEEFESAFRDNFITEDDFRIIKELGANCVRVPFHYSLFDRNNYQGEKYFSLIFSWAYKYDLGIILDLHAAYGGQNCDWHSDSKGRALLWESKTNRDKTISLWEKIVDKFSGEKQLIGYDLLNEPVIDRANIDILVDFYRILIRKIRSLDSKHILFVEGNIWATDIDFLRDIIVERTSNICVSIHFYAPLDYTFNFTPFYQYPGKINGQYWDKDTIYEALYSYYKFSQDFGIKVFVGEFGINYRGDKWGELVYLKDVIDVFETLGFDYTYWTYKTVAYPYFPTGIYQYIPNDRYVNREGPLYGWENLIPLWERDKENIKKFFRTQSYILNRELGDLLKKSFQRGEDEAYS